jgi:flagellar M-ring protein FliF
LPARLTAIWKRISETVAGFSFAQKTVSILAILVLVVGITALSLWLTRPQYVPLFSGLAASDAEAITTQLHTDNVPYQLTDGGQTILVPQADVYTERLKAASNNLPSSANQGYTLLNNMGVTTSEFQQNVYYKEAMEGELANTIDAMTGVKTASVKLAIPQSTVFTDSQQDPTASVFIAEDAGTTLSSDQVQAIVHLVSASITGMQTTDVTVIDAAGNVLSAQGSGASGSSTDQQNAYDSSTQSSIQAMLDKVLGTGNSTVVVNALMDPSTATKTTDTYTVPTGAPTTSSSDQKETYTGTGAASAAGVLGSSSDTTSGTDTSTDGTGDTTGSSGNGNYSSDNLTQDSALNKTTETQQIPAGTLQRQSVSVAVNRAAATKNNVSTTQLQALVANAAGVEKSRGDQVTVQLVDFSKANAQAAQQALKQAGQQQFQSQIGGWVKDGITGMSIIAGLFIVMMLIRRWTRPQPEAAPVGELEDPVMQMTSFVTEPPTIPMDLPEEAISARRRRAEIEALAERDPHQAAEFLRGLMDERAGV